MKGGKRFESLPPDGASIFAIGMWAMISSPDGSIELQDALDVATSAPGIRLISERKDSSGAAVD
jgi:hypothetical protein